MCCKISIIWFKFIIIFFIIFIFFSNKINKVISKAEIPVYLFGAHVFSQYLISFGLDTSNIVYLLDNDIRKEGKRLYGTSLTSKSPKILKDIPNALVILRVGVYNEEVKKDILANINPNIIFIW